MLQCFLENIKTTSKDAEKFVHPQQNQTNKKKSKTLHDVAKKKGKKGRSCSKYQPAKPDPYACGATHKYFLCSRLSFGGLGGVLSTLEESRTQLHIKETGCIFAKRRNFTKYDPLCIKTLKVCSFKKVVIDSRSESNGTSGKWRLKILGKCGHGPSIKGMFNGSSLLEE
ncbi:hypothetical protein RND71_031927 [Anisodus tanguticus]|uniref:Uncharacterized protein n=1 Tax=Anisodus tanguticus TaxID=243964 RepID=A0AAE1REF5_9SOLA|nr:hypothetical protein RND71_031927 [Anisodus tanguticus]